MGLKKLNMTITYILTSNSLQMRSICELRIYIWEGLREKVGYRDALHCFLLTYIDTYAYTHDMKSILSFPILTEPSSTHTFFCSNFFCPLPRQPGLCLMIFRGPGVCWVLSANQPDTHINQPDGHLVVLGVGSLVQDG